MVFIISTVPYEQQKIYRQKILFQKIYYLSISLTGIPCHREPSIVLMSMGKYLSTKYSIPEKPANKYFCCKQLRNAKKLGAFD